jgi:hypothetical protein
MCNHTFCEECIKKWLERMHTCPTCRQVCSNNYQHHSAFHQPRRTFAYVKINTRIVLNQLDRLLVRCLACGESNIQRCNYQNHEKTCSKKVVFCPAADIKCTWKGPRDELTTHSNNCPFQQLRPIIDELKDELNSTKVDLKTSVDSLQNKVNLLLQIINKGNLMTQECTMPMNECKYKITDTPTTKIRFKCDICDKYIQHEQISVHACSGGCICRSCVNIQYSDDSDRRDEPVAYDDEEDSYGAWN